MLCSFAGRRTTSERFNYIFDGHGQVFVSYRSLDKQFAGAFANELRRYAHEIKGDLEGLLVTPDYDASLLKGLTESDAIVFLFTANASGSENILGEVGSAKVLHSLRQRPHMIPVVFPGGTLPEPLSRVWAQVLAADPTPEVLAAKIDSLLARLPLNQVSRLPDVISLEKITLRWLLEHVPIGYGVTLLAVFVSAIAATFTFGVKAGQVDWVATLFGEKDSKAGAVHVDNGSTNTRHSAHP